MELEEPPQPPSGIWPPLPSDPRYEDWLAMRGWSAAKQYFWVTYGVAALVCLWSFNRGDAWTWGMFFFFVGCTFFIACFVGFIAAGIRQQRLDVRRYDSWSVPVHFTHPDDDLITAEIRSRAHEEATRQGRRKPRAGRRVP